LIRLPISVGILTILFFCPTNFLRLTKLLIDSGKPVIELSLNSNTSRFLRFPIFLNGSKSYILRTIKDKDKLSFLPLYFDAKKDDKHGNFENALNCLKDDIKEVFNFLSMFPEIITRTDNENINNMNGKYLFFFFFVVFNHSLFRFMKTLQNAI